MQLPKDFSWDELVRLFGIFGYLLDSKGKTSGSRAQFVKGDDVHTVHCFIRDSIKKQLEVTYAL